MPNFLIRWPNGTITFIDAKSDEDAKVVADEVGNAFSKRCVVRRVKHLFLDFDVVFDKEAYQGIGRLAGPSYVGGCFEDEIDSDLEACRELQRGHKLAMEEDAARREARRKAMKAMADRLKKDR